MLKNLYKDLQMSKKWKYAAQGLVNVVLEVSDQRYGSKNEYALRNHKAADHISLFSYMTVIIDVK